MGVFKINGTDILTIAEVISTSDKRGKSAAFSSGKLNVTGLSTASKTLANAPSGYFWTENLVGLKLKVNGTADTVSRVGCRPQLNSLIQGDIIDGYTVTLSKQSDGSVYASYSANSGLNKTVVPASVKAKYIYVTVQSAGGAGGQGKNNNQGGGSGGGSGAACLFGVRIDHTGNFLEMNISGYTTGGGGQTTVYYIDSAGTKTLVATLAGGYKGADGYSSSGGAAGSGSWGTAHSNIHRIDVLSGLTGGHGIQKGSGGAAATAGSSNRYSKTYGPSGENNTLNINVSGGAASGTDPGGGGAASRFPYYADTGAGGAGGASGNAGHPGGCGAGGGGGANKGVFQSAVSGGRGGAGCYNIMY